jgi:ADP-ribose pyrophosphatase
LKEETGLKAKKWIKLSSFYASPGYVAEKMNLFLALDLTDGEQNLMEDERIEIGWFGRKEMGEMIHSGKIVDAKTIIGYYLWLDWLKSSKRLAAQS